MHISNIFETFQSSAITVLQLLFSLSENSFNSFLNIGTISILNYLEM